MGEKTKQIKLDPGIMRDIWSEDQGTVLKAIHKLRYEGNIHYIPELIKLLNQTGKEPVERELIRFLADIKDSAAAPLILDSLRDPELAPARGNIISACWQSGFDFSDDLMLFIELFLDGDYRTALESFTVIEESVIKLGKVELEKARERVLGELKQVGEEKIPLALELVRILET